MQAWLETESGEKFALLGDCSLGRHSSCNIVLKDDQISRRHALIHSQGMGERWLVDLGSSNGTQLNGRRVRQPVALKDQDRIEIGGTLLIFCQPAVPAEPEPEDDSADSDMTMKASVTTDHWLLIGDIEKFTPLSQTMPGDELARMVGKWILSCKEAIEKHGGEINKYLGDGFLAYWPLSGAPSADIARAIADLKKVQAECAMKFRIVLHHGAITLDNSLSHGENSLIGPNVNLVFRIEKIAGNIQQYCILSEAASELLKEFGPVTPLGQFALPGFRGEHTIYSY
jgi:adenylate cyclase